MTCSKIQYFTAKWTDKQMHVSYQGLARQSPNKAFYWYISVLNETSGLKKSDYT